MTDKLLEIQECWEKKLDSQEKLLFVLHFDHGYSIDDLAKEFSMTKVGMWQKIEAIKNKIKEFMGGN